MQSMGGARHAVGVYNHNECLSCIFLVKMSLTFTRLVRLSAYLVALLGVQNLYAQTTQCRVGDDSQTPQTILTEFGFYLNTQNPATCNGTVTAWELCYYNVDPQLRADEYMLTWGLYRMVNSGSYQLVTSIFSLSISRSNYNFGSRVTCTTAFVPRRVFIQRGDIVGACIYDVDQGSSRQAQLNIAGAGPGFSLQYADTSNSRCNSGLTLLVPNNVPIRDLNTRSSTILHLYAVIDAESNVDTTKTTELIVDTSQTTEFIVDTTQTTELNVDTSTTSTIESMSMVSTNTVGNTDDEFGTSNGTVAPDSIALIITVAGGVAGGFTILFLCVFLITITCCIWSIRKPSWNVHATNPLVHSIDTDDIMEDNRAYIHHRTRETSYMYTSEADDHSPAYEDVIDNESVEEVYDDIDEQESGNIIRPVVPYSTLLKENQQRDIYINLKPYRPPSKQETAIYGIIRSYAIVDIPRTAIRSTGFLGSGQFANVEEGTWKKGVNKEVRVALKTMKEGASRDDKIKFLQEAAVMAQFRHPNVVSLYGVVSKGDPVVLVIELVHKGDLRQHLNSIRPDPGEMPSADLPKLLLSFCQQVALGMQYLSGKGFVHRDLAARNILVSEEKICKVSDFGMSRDLLDESCYIAQRGEIPVKWTAPEAINFKEYSTASDVWSYGCLLFEIWSLGRKPFDGISNMKVVRSIESGHRLHPPPGCPQAIYLLMIKCWNPNKASRPSFRDIILTLLGDEKDVLFIPEKVTRMHPLARVLGAPLEAGERMYEDLQYTYIDERDYEEMD